MSTDTPSMTNAMLSDERLDAILELAAAARVLTQRITTTQNAGL